MTKDPAKVSSDMIACTKIQKEWLKEHGKFGETFADILQRMIDYWEEGHNEKSFKKLTKEARDKTERELGG